MANNEQLTWKKYDEAGLADIYFDCLSFISKYLTDHFDPMEVLKIKDGEISDQKCKEYILLNLDCALEQFRKEKEENRTGSMSR